MYNYYCKLISIRHRYPAIARGAYNSISCGHKNLGGFVIEYEGDRIVLIHNTSMQELTYDLSKCSELESDMIKKIGDTIGIGYAKLEGTILTIGPQTSVILE